MWIRCRDILGKLLDINDLGPSGSQAFRSVAELRVCENQPRSRIADDVLNPGAGVRRIQRDVTSIRLEYPKYCGECWSAVA